MRITVVYFVNVTCTYSSILVKWVVLPTFGVIVC